MNFNVSVITPVFNNELFIERTINSVLSQKGIKIEYIIIDGKSKDNTVQIIEKYIEKIDKFVSEPDDGLYDAINKGIRLSNSENIVILNSGDYYNNEFSLKYLVSCSEANKHQKIIYGKKLIQNEDFSEPDLIGTNVQKRTFMLRGCDVPHPTTLIPKNIYKKYGLYSNNFKVMSDYDLLLRMHRFGVIFEGIDETIIIFQRGGISSNFFTCIQESYKVRQNNGINFFVNLFFSIRSLIYFSVHFIIKKLGFNNHLNSLIKIRRKYNL